jgi:Na+-transporting NADH:ubiquinone oxidoreductase subunit NqrB
VLHGDGENNSKFRKLIDHLKLENKKHLEYENKNKIDEYIDDYFFKNTKHTSSNKYVRDSVYQLFQNIMIAG